jgi:hypothetical protein
MNAHDCYKKYKHMDKMLSDEQWRDIGSNEQMIYDFWMAIKETVNEKELGKSGEEETR